VERIKRTYSKEYPILRLFKDDLEQIGSIFEENFEEYEIVADEYKLNDISEIVRIGKQKTSYFRISANNPFMSLQISAISARLEFLDEDDIRLCGIASKIDSILTRRRSLLRILDSKWAQLPWYIVLFLTFVFFPLEYKVRVKLLPITLIVLYSLWLFLGYRVSTKKHSLIYLYDSYSRLGFFRRNKDQILLVVFGAVIGGFISALARAFF
jgi:hypothetical protein